MNGILPRGLKTFSGASETNPYGHAFFLIECAKF